MTPLDGPATASGKSGQMAAPPMSGQEGELSLLRNRPLLALGLGRPLAIDGNADNAILHP